MGYPDERLGERMCAFITLVPGADAPTLAELGAFLEADGLARIKVPETLPRWIRLGTAEGSGKFVFVRVRFFIKIPNIWQTKPPVCYVDPQRMGEVEKPQCGEMSSKLLSEFRPRTP